MIGGSSFVAMSVSLLLSPSLAPQPLSLAVCSHPTAWRKMRGWEGCYTLFGPLHLVVRSKRWSIPFCVSAYTQLTMPSCASHRILPSRGCAGVATRMGVDVSLATLQLASLPLFPAYAMPVHPTRYVCHDRKDYVCRYTADTPCSVTSCNEKFVTL